MSIPAVTIMKYTNQGTVAEYLYHHDHTTRQILERQLNLSLPTIRQHVSRLHDIGLVKQGESLDSTGGRKAQTYEFVFDARAAIGVSLRADHVTLCAVNLRGDVIARKRITTPYANTDDYYRHIGRIIQAFADDTTASGSPVLGVAFSIQGIVSSDGTSVIFGNINGNTGLKLETITQAIDLPCMLIHDSDASAMAELWFDPTISDAVCFYLERRPGGAVIVNGRLYQGPNLCNGTIEHMRLVPDGRECYCGHRGCVDPYCSLDALLDKQQEPSEFFARLHSGDRECRTRFNSWIGYVAQTIAAVRSLLAGDIILGGEAAPYLNDQDITQLKELVQELSAFPTALFDIRASAARHEQDIVGAALRYIQPFVTDLFEHGA